MNKPWRQYGVLVLLLVAALSPIAFLGLDFTDFGFHFMVQTTVFEPSLFFYLSAYTWLSNLVPGLLISTTKSFLLFKVLGVATWIALAVAFCRWLGRLLGTLSSGSHDGLLLVWCIFPAILVSTKSITAGALIIPDYYTMALLPVVWLVFSTIESGQDMRSSRRRALIFFVLCLLPMLRWPLLLVSIAGAAVLTFEVRSNGRRYLMAIPAAMILILVLYKAYFLDVFTPRISTPGHGVQQLLQLYWGETRRLLVASAEVLVVALLLKGVFQLPGLRSRSALLPIAIFAYLAWRDFWTSMSITLNQQVVLVSSGFLIFYVWKNRHATSVDLLTRYLAASLLCIGFYPLGSDTGLIKMGYLSFLVSAPALFLLAKGFSKSWQRAGLVGVASVAAILYLYSSLYRDDISELIREPALVRDDVLGVVLTTSSNRKTLEQFKSIAVQVESTSDHILVAPYGPLLGVYLERFYIRMSWPEIKSAAAVESEIKMLCSSGKKSVLILSKVNFTSIKRELVDPNEISSLPKIWKQYCGSDLVAENELFFVLGDKARHSSAATR